MTPYATRRIPKEDLALFARIKAAVTTMQDPDLGLNEDGERITLSCHMLARAVAHVFRVWVRDGYFTHKLYDHSWVVTPHGHIIDVYPIGTIGGPIMFDNSRFSPCPSLYKRCSAREISRGRFSEYSFQRSVYRIVNALRATQR